MRRLLAFTVLAFVLLAAPALGGGFATTGLSSLPDGTAPGEPWVVDVTVLAHGRTPIAGMEPTITIARGADERTFAARPIRTGVYRAEVVFPDAGRWSYEVDSGFGLGPETFAPVDIRAPDTAPAAASSDSGRWLAALGAGLLAGLVAALLTRRRPGRQPLPTA